MSKNFFSVLCGLLALLALAPAEKVHAGGLYMFDRGARALSRGGAFVAGADDPSSLWYNPAGLKDSKNQVLTDATLTFMISSFERVNVGSDGNADYTYPKVKSKNQLIPIPTLAISHNFGLRDFTFGAGIFAPNTIVVNWPQSVDVGGVPQPSPTRYSIRGLKGSVLSNLAVGGAWHGIDGLSIGADVQLVVGQFKVETTLSSCDRFICSFPEQPDFDARSEVKLFPAVAVTGVLGVTYDMDIMRIGASVMLPYKLQGSADLQIKLPDAPIFSGANVTGNKADMAVNFPLIVRVGSELRPIKAIRLEGTFVWEQWSSQKEIEIKPRNVRLNNVSGIGDYDVGNVTLPRNMNNTWSLRGGSELFVPRRWSPWGLKWVMRGGLAYEKGAFKSSAMTPLTMDSNKVVLTGGFGVNLHKRLRFDTVAGYIFMADPKVRDSAINQPQAIRPTTENFGTPLGNGNYKMDALYLGGGFALDIN
jgi:long-chain fatty acid transport protein